MDAAQRFRDFPPVHGAWGGFRWYPQNPAAHPPDKPEQTLGPGTEESTERQADRERRGYLPGDRVVRGWGAEGCRNPEHFRSSHNGAVEGP